LQQTLEHVCRNLKVLQSLELNGCNALNSLPDLSGLEALGYLGLSCPSRDGLPKPFVEGLQKLKALQCINLEPPILLSQEALDKLEKDLPSISLSSISIQDMRLLKFFGALPKPDEK
jgi:hypothetical protein